MRFFCTDIHGRHTALKQVLKRSRFDLESDLLIFGGDIVDRGEQPFECIHELNKIKNKILIAGNHDINFFDYISIGYDSFQGHNGVEITKKLWKQTNDQTKAEVLNFLNSQIPYYIDAKNNIFTHAGFDWERPVAEQLDHVFAWDRELVQEAMRSSKKLKTADKFRMVFLGHTPTIIWDKSEPILKGGVFNCDTGAGFSSGKLTIVNVDTLQFFQSDPI